MRSILVHLAKEQGDQVHEVVVLSAVVHIFNEIAMHARAQACNRTAKANRASHGPRVSPRTQAKATVRKTRENPKENPKEPKVRTKGSKSSHKGKTSKNGLSGLQNSKSEVRSEPQESAQTCPTATSWNDGWNGDERNYGWSLVEWNDDWSSVGGHEGWEQTNDTSASSLSLGGLDARATSGPKRFECVRMNLDTGAALNTFPLNFGPEGAGDGRFYRTASGEWIPDGGAWQFQGYDENGFLMEELGSFKDLMRTDCSDL